MNETQIAEQLKQNLPKPDPQPDGPPPDEPPQNPGYVADIGDSLDLYKLYDFFGVETPFRTGDAEQKLQAVYRWGAERAQSTDYLRVTKLLGDLEQSMGASYAMGNRLERMYNYVKLDVQIARLKDEQAWLFNGE